MEKQTNVEVNDYQYMTWTDGLKTLYIHMTQEQATKLGDYYDFYIRNSDVYATEEAKDTYVKNLIEEFFNEQNHDSKLPKKNREYRDVSWIERNP